MLCYVCTLAKIDERIQLCKSCDRAGYHFSCVETCAERGTGWEFCMSCNSSQHHLSCIESCAVDGTGWRCDPCSDDRKTNYTDATAQAQAAAAAVLEALDNNRGLFCNLFGKYCVDGARTSAGSGGVRPDGSGGNNWAVGSSSSVGSGGGGSGGTGGSGGSNAGGSGFGSGAGGDDEPPRDKETLELGNTNSAEGHLKDSEEDDNGSTRDGVGGSASKSKAKRLAASMRAETTHQDRPTSRARVAKGGKMEGTAKRVQGSGVGKTSNENVDFWMSGLRKIIIQHHWVPLNSKGKHVERDLVHKMKELIEKVSSRCRSTDAQILTDTQIQTHQSIDTHTSEHKKINQNQGTNILLFSRVWWFSLSRHTLKYMQSTDTDRILISSPHLVYLSPNTQGQGATRRTRPGRDAGCASHKVLYES